MGLRWSETFRWSCGDKKAIVRCFGAVFWVFVDIGRGIDHGGDLYINFIDLLIIMMCLYLRFAEIISFLRVFAHLGFL